MNEAAASYLELSYWRVAIAAALILVNAGLSVVLRLGIERRLLIAAARTVTQLLLVGLVLRWVFALSEWYAVVGLTLLMVLAASRAAIGNVSRRYSGIWLDGLLAMGLSSWSVTALALIVIVRPEPWFHPQYAIPLLGMMLGNSLNGVSLGLERLGEELSGKRSQIDGYLALGASRWEAGAEPVRTAIRTGLVPITNSMMVVGIVSLPGMMTGQLLAGASPVEAVKYQVMVMFLIATATAIGTLTVVLLAFNRLFSRDHQFLRHRLLRNG
ncbi:MAG: iron export ABC transporter permease subunit FetB [Acidobacteria bacterium]|nr:iron export ABC transporter permease subunit FetB [Acidobacteriota bacterium]